MEQRKLAWYQLFFLHRPAAEEGLAAGDWALLRAMLAGESPNVQQQYIEALAQPGEYSLPSCDQHGWCCDADQLVTSAPPLLAPLTWLLAAGALTAALNWYRANTPPAMFAQLEPGKLPLVQCPTLGVWSSGDTALTEAQMKASQQQVVPCKWRYARLEGCNHWVPRGAAQQLNQLLLNFLPSDGDAATAPAAVSRL
jgi:pimeloyl-ACP methyl ester carboxylesterase